MNADDRPVEGPVDRPADGPVDMVDAALQGLPRAIEPPRDLWPAIAAEWAARDERRMPRRRYPWLLPAVAAMVLVAASSLVTASLLGYRQQNANSAARTTQANPETTNPAAGATASDTPAAFGPGYALDNEYVAARSQLASTLQARIERMPPSARQKLEANLAEMHRRLSGIFANDLTLGRHPGWRLIGATGAELTIDLGRPTRVGIADLREQIDKGQLVASYRIEGHDGTRWRLLTKGATIGYRKLDRFPPAPVRQVRVLIDDALDAPHPLRLGLYAP